MRTGCRQGLFILIFLLIPGALRADPVILLTIEQAYDACLEHSLELRTSRLEILAERRRIALGYWTSLPSLNVSLSDSRLVRYNEPDNKSVSLSTSLTIPVFNGGRVRIQRKIDSLSADLQELLLTAGEKELRDSCFIHFHEFHLLSLKCEALSRTGKIAERQYAIARTEYDLGTARELDVVETRLYLEEIHQALYSTETEKLTHEFALRKLLNIDGTTRIQPVSLLDSGYTGLDLADKSIRLYSAALEKNITLRQNRYLIEQARLQNRLLNAQWLPNIRLQGSVQLRGEAYPLQYPDYALRAFMDFPNDLLPVSFSFGISTTPEREYGRSLTTSAQSPASLQPLAEKHLARIRLSLALEANRESQRELRYSLEEAVQAHERQRRSQELLRHRMATQETKTEILRTQAELGQITRLEYLEGENELLTSRLEHLSGVFELLRMERAIASLAGLEPAELVNVGREP